jgi:multidrug resistance efflux pump
MAAHDQPIETPYLQKVEDFKRRRLPVLVWSTAALVCLWILAGRVWRYEYIGLAQAAQYEISSNTVGKIEIVTVDLLEQVEQGEMVAKLVDQELEASIETANATLAKLEADLEAARVQLQSSSGQDKAAWVADLRNFQMNEEQRRLDTLQLRVGIEGDEIEQERLDLELKRARPLLDSGLLGQTQFDQTRLQRDLVRKRLEDNAILLAQLEEKYVAARTRRESFENALPRRPAEEPLLRPLREAIAVESRRLQEIEVRRGDLTLRSPVAGQVTQILCRAGQSVVPGEPIVTVTEAVVNEVVAYLQEGDSRQVAPSSRVRVASASRSRSAESVVLRVGGSLEVMPQRLWLDPAIPTYGRAVVVAAVPELRLTPGERVDVTFLRER